MCRKIVNMFKLDMEKQKMCSQCCCCCKTGRSVNCVYYVKQVVVQSTKLKYLRT